MKSIDECLEEASRSLSDARLKGREPKWSPRLIEAVRYAVTIFEIEKNDGALEFMEFFLNGVDVKGILNGDMRPKVGDMVVFPDGVERKITEEWTKDGRVK